MVTNLLTLAQVITSIIVIILILLQERSSGMSGVFGGAEGGGFYQKRRGVERIIFVATILGITIFALLALAKIVLPFS